VKQIMVSAPKGALFALYDAATGHVMGRPSVIVGVAEYVPVGKKTLRQEIDDEIRRHTGSERPELAGALAALFETRLSNEAIRKALAEGLP